MSVIAYIVAMEFVASFGNEKKLVNITQVKGASGISYHILIDNYFQGSIDQVKGDRKADRKAEWVPHLNRNTILTGDDVTVIISMIGEIGGIDTYVAADTY